MFRTSSQEILEILLKKAIHDCSGNTNYVYTLVKLMDKKYFWAAFVIDSMERTFGLHGSPGSESNHSSVKNLYHTFWKVFMVLCNN